MSISSAKNAEYVQFDLYCNPRFFFLMPSYSDLYLLSHPCASLFLSIITNLRSFLLLISQSLNIASSSMNLEENISMDIQVPPSEHLCYVHCNFCNTVLAVGIPCKRLLDTVTVKCGHCSNLSFLSTRPPQQDPCQMSLSFEEKQSFCSDFKLGNASSSSSSTPSEPLSPKAPFVVKPPEKKHRLPSAYNRFMKEEIQRIKAANPEISHREAFSSAAKNWARYIPNSLTGSSSRSSCNE